MAATSTVPLGADDGAADDAGGGVAAGFASCAAGAPAAVPDPGAAGLGTDPHAVHGRTSPGSLAMFAAMRCTSSQILPVLSSFPSLFRLRRWTGWNQSSAGWRRGSGGLQLQEEAC